MEEKFLPIGSVVILKGGKRELMITSYCIMPSGGELYDKNGKVEVKEPIMFDYGACFYPEGMITSDQLFAFNHDQIDHICFTGYVTDAQKNISNLLNNNMAEIKQQMTKMVSQTENQKPAIEQIETLDGGQEEGQQ